MNDEVFRRAAEDYFLEAGKPGWESVLNKLNADDASAIQLDDRQNKKKQFRFLYLLNASRAVFRLFGLGNWLEKSKKKSMVLFVAGLGASYYNITTF